MGSDPIIVWFRRDLRMADNPALLHAAQDGSPVVPVYLADWEQGDEWAPGAAGRWWLERSLARFTADLAFQGASLRAVPGDPQEVLPKLARDIGARQVVWNRLYEPRSRDLDGRVATALGREGVASRAFGAALLFEPDGHVSRTGRAFTQFTAFWRSCLGKPEPERRQVNLGRCCPLHHPFFLQAEQRPENLGEQRSGIRPERHVVQILFPRYDFAAAANGERSMERLDVLCCCRRDWGRHWSCLANLPVVADSEF